MEWYNEIYAIEKCGFRWMSWFGIPIKGTPGYPNKCRVRQLLSPKQLASDSWKEHFERADGRDADGTEPLSYSYCSSGCDVAMVPDLINEELRVDLARCVKAHCKCVPQDIGRLLANIVREHLRSTIRKEPDEVADSPVDSAPPEPQNQS